MTELFARPSYLMPAPCRDKSEVTRKYHSQKVRGTKFLLPKFSYLIAALLFVSALSLFRLNFR